jgi:CelD/BcsL family acetyltransferase involved in cellulose biosynthesis
MPRLLEQGALDLSWLEVRGEPVAALYSIVWDGKVHFYQSGRKPDVPQNIRPGIVLHVHAIQRAIAAGLREYDFLGGASQYKTRMSTATRGLVQLRATRAAVLDTVRGVAKTGMSNVRAWLHRQQSAASS